ncbi:MAG TPA: sugar transferase [Clostridia bacterium]|nr:sugar transferase [Clostridia bacterium]
MTGLYQFSKRCLDIALSIVGLIVTAPLTLFIAVLIKFSDPGPIFYRQTRIGQFGGPFRIWKFRTMVVDAERKGLSVTRDRDPRITPIGRILRKSKLDELPQLINVLVGEMSFVGPRPEVPKYVQLYTPEQRKILELKPGITDLASIAFRNEEDLLAKADDVEEFYIRVCIPKKIQLNLDYANRASLLGDISIICQTLLAIALSRNQLPPPAKPPGP